MANSSNKNDGSSRARTRRRVPDGDGKLDTCSNTPGSRARAHTREAHTREAHTREAQTQEAFYGPAVLHEVDVAVDEALKQLNGDPRYRRALCFYCLRLGINTFLDQLDCVMSCYQQGELREPAKAFYARLRYIKDSLDKREGGAK